MIRLFPNCGGWLEVVCGPMFSGKSEELIRRLRRAEIAGQRALIVKPRLDNRYDPQTSNSSPKSWPDSAAYDAQRSPACGR